MPLIFTPEQLARRLRQDAGRLPGVVARGLHRAAHRGRALLVSLSPVDTGQFKNAWRVLNRPPSLQPPSIHNAAPHAGIIERGARPHAVSAEGREALRRWVRRVLGAELKLNLRAQSPGGRVRTRDFEAQVESIVRGIVQKLARVGQKGHFLVEKNLDRLAEFARQEVEAALRLHFERPPA